MAYEIAFIMKCIGYPCKYEIYITLDDCINRMKELINLPIKWYDFRIHEIESRYNSLVWGNDYLIKLYERRQFKCGN